MDALKSVMDKRFIEQQRQYNEAIQTLGNSYAQQYARLMKVVNDTINIMTPSLNELMQLGTQMSSAMEGRFILTNEEATQLRMEHYRASRRVELAYGQALVRSVECQTGR